MIHINFDMQSQLHANYHTGYPIYKCSFIPKSLPFKRIPTRNRMIRNFVRQNLTGDISIFRELSLVIIDY